MNNTHKRYFYCRSLNHSLEPMNGPRIKEAGFDLNVAREDIPFFITFFRDLANYYEQKAAGVDESYRVHIEEVAAFFHEQVQDMSQCISMQGNSSFYAIPFTDFVASFMLADEAFERIFEENKQMANQFDKVLTYYKRFNLQADPVKAQFILDHLPELCLKYD